MTDSPVNQPKDLHVRQRCLDPRQSFSVRAPAGSGKTELLTQRILVLLARVQNPEEILSITFTRKAAAEMLDRLLENLNWAATADEPEAGFKQHTWRLAKAALAQDKQQGWQLLNNPNRLRIQTIDGLCSRLTQSLPIESGLGASPEITAQPYPLYQQAVQRLLVSLESADETSHALANLLKHLDNQVERLQELLINMLVRRDQWLPWLGYGADISSAKDYLQDAVSRVVYEELSTVKEQLHIFESELVHHIDYAASNLAPDTKLKTLQACEGIKSLPELSVDDLPTWAGIKTLLLTDKGTWRKSITVREGFPPGKTKEEKAIAKERKEQFLALAGEIKSIVGLEQRLARIPLLPKDQYANSQWQLLESLTQILPRLVAELLLCFKDAGAVDFAEITQRALIALGNEDAPTELSLKLDYQIQHILVDEFQDTSTPQIRLLERLTQGWQQDDGKTLFIVGDGMQSCYGFRDANVGLFLDARQHGIGPVSMQPADLEVNFRSQSAVVDWVNQTFNDAFPIEDDISRGAVSYEHSTAFNPTNENTHHISLTGFVDFPDRQAEAEKVCQLVQQSLSDFPDDNVAILVRNRTHLREILPALRDEGLKWQATDLDRLSSRMCVVDLVSLLRAWLNPADRIAWLSVLRAPWCGLSNADLLAIAGLERKQWPIWQSLLQIDLLTNSTLTESGIERIQGLVAIFTSAFNERGRLPLRDEIERLWLALKAPAFLNNASEQADIERVLALIDQHDTGGFLDSFELFQRDLDNLYASPDSDADPRIQVMTIHKSKGLEFNTVILAGLDRSARSNDKQLLMWQQRINQQGDEDLLLSPIAATGADEDSLYQFLREEQKLKEKMEGTRLLYVGATRAIDRLHIVSHLNSDSKNAPKAPSSSSLLAAIWNNVREQYQFIQADNDNELEDETEVKRIIRRVKQPIRPQLMPKELTSEGLNRPTADWNFAARHMGTVIHRILQQKVINPTLFTRNTIESLSKGWQQQLVQLGLSRHLAIQLIPQISQQVERVLADDNAKWIFDPSYQDSVCELPLTAMIGNKPRNLVIDRAFIDADGVRWIIDYKTAELPEGVSQQAFIQHEVETYRPQLSMYRTAFAMREPGREIKTALYFTQFSHIEIV